MHGRGPYGEQIQRTVEYTLSCQRDNGIFSEVKQYEGAEQQMAPARTAMDTLGEEYWRHFFPGMVRLMRDNQGPEGNWRAEGGPGGHLGNVYTTALVITRLCAHNQLLPIFQR